MLFNCVFLGKLAVASIVNTKFVENFKDDSKMSPVNENSNVYEQIASIKHWVKDKNSPKDINVAYTNTIYFMLAFAFLHKLVSAKLYSILIVSSQFVYWIHISN